MLKHFEGRFSQGKLKEASQLKRMVLLVFLVVSMFSLGFYLNERMTVPTFTIVAKSDEVPIYIEHLNDYYPMGTLYANTPVEPLQQLEDYYEIAWGNGTGYLRKEDVVEQERKIKKRAIKHPSNEMVYTIEQTPIYERSFRRLIPIASIEAGFRYPIVREYNENWWEVNVGGRSGYIAKKSTEPDRGIPVLMYHHLLKPEEKEGSTLKKSSSTITTEEFEMQMRYLHEEGYVTLRTEDLEQYLKKQRNVPAKAVVLTMDDGNISSRIYGYPILQKYGLFIDQFMITERTPDEPLPFNFRRLDFLSHEEMRAMTDHYGFHSHTHGLHWQTEEKEPFLLVKPKEEVLADLRLSRSLLYQTPYLAYPFGQYDEEGIELVKKAGFRLAYTTKPGYVTLNTNPYEIPRLGIEPYLPLEEFISKVKLPRPLREEAPFLPSIELKENL